jgi:hypothetical protein
VLAARIEAMRAERARVDAEAAELAERLPAAGIEVGALAGHPGIESFRTARQAALRDDEATLAGLRSTSAQIAAGISAAEEYLERYRGGWREDPRAHLGHAATPEPPSVTRRRVFAETWAALSVGMLAIALALSLWFDVLPLGATLLALAVGYLTIESFAQRRAETLLLRITIVLAAISALLLGWHYLRELVLIGLAALGLFILLDNARELSRR